MAYMHQNIFIPSDNNPTLRYPSGMGTYSSEAAVAPFHSATGSTAYYQIIPQYIQPPRRRSSTTSPYPISIHDNTRSPTCSRFPSSQSSTTYPYDVSYTHSPTRSRQNSAVIGPDRQSRTYGRPQAENVHYVKSGSGKPVSIHNGPSNHALVPQGVFMEPASSRSHHYRYSDIKFKLGGFPEKGVKLASLLIPRPLPLDGHDDHVFKEVSERELKCQIVWPGYPPYERRIKTQKGMMGRGELAYKLAGMVLDFACHIKHTRTQIEKECERWKIVNEPSLDCVNASDIFLTKFYHCGGCHWQMELWIPKEGI